MQKILVLTEKEAYALACIMANVVHNDKTHYLLCKINELLDVELDLDDYANVDFFVNASGIPNDGKLAKDLCVSIVYGENQIEC